MAFTFKLEQEDGTPADPPILKTAVPNWSPGNTIAISAARTLEVIEVRVDDPSDAPTLVVKQK
jgi:hypothetical protein